MSKLYGQITLSMVEDGAPGISVVSIEVQYYISSSATELLGGEWSTESPTWVDGTYIWTRAKTFFSDDTESISNPICTTGSKGSTGNSGRSVVSIIPQFYLSTSSISPTGGEWSIIPPQWSNGKYLWTRNEITYKDPTEIEYTDPIFDRTWEAINVIDSTVETVSLRVDENEKQIESKVSSSQEITVYKEIQGEDADHENVTQEETKILVDAINHTIQRLESTRTEISETQTTITDVSKSLVSFKNESESTIEGLKQEISKSSIVTDTDGNEVSVQEFFNNYRVYADSEEQRMFSYIDIMLNENSEDEDAQILRTNFETFIKRTAEGITTEYVKKSDVEDIAKLTIKETADDVNWLFSNCFSKDFQGVQFNYEGIVVYTADSSGNTIGKTVLGSNGLNGYATNNGVDTRIFYLTDTGSGQNEATIDSGVINFKSSANDSTPSFKTEIQTMTRNGETRKVLVFI